MKTTVRSWAARGGWRMWGAVAAVAVAAGPAHAFYWFGWPGSNVPEEPSLVTPPSLARPTPAGPKTPPPGGQPGGPPVPVDKPPVGPPQQTPEPATGVIALIGLGALAARRWRKKD